MESIDGVLTQRDLDEFFTEFENARFKVAFEPTEENKSILKKAAKVLVEYDFLTEEDKIGVEEILNETK